MKRLMWLAVAALALGLAAQAAAQVKPGYPTMYCNRGTNPTSCTWVSGTTPLPVTLSATSGGAVAAMGSTMALATLGQAVRAGMFTYTVNGWVAVDVTHPFPVRPSADGTNPVDGTHPLPVSKNLTANGPHNPTYTTPVVCHPDINPAATNYAACTGADQSVGLPGADGDYLVYIMGASGVGTKGQAASLTGEGIPLFEGVPNGPFRIDDATPALRVICTSAAGKIWIVKCASM
jgi:hypothetical protein